MNYPKRDAYYAHRITRLLFKSCAAQHIGQDAVLLVIHIAHTEDAARYQGPVRFWNSQLNEVLGFRSPKTLNNARSKAVEAGWLVYTRKNDRTDGLYFTTIPERVSRFDDTPIESVPSTESIPSTERISVPSTEQKAERESYALRNGKVTGNDPPPNPIPFPIPNPNKKEEASASSESFSQELSSWVEWWNGLHKRKLVHAGTKASEANTRALRKAKANPELCTVLSDRPKLEKEIQQSEFIRGTSWFTLPKLLAGKNKDGEHIAQRLADGGYRSGKAKPVYSEGANYDPAREAGNVRF